MHRRLKYYERARCEQLSLLLNERAHAETQLLEDQRKLEEQDVKLVRA